MADRLHVGSVLGTLMGVAAVGRVGGMDLVHPGGCSRMMFVLDLLGRMSGLLAWEGSSFGRSREIGGGGSDQRWRLTDFEAVAFLEGLAETGTVLMTAGGNVILMGGSLHQVRPRRKVVVVEVRSLILRLILLAVGGSGLLRLGRPL